MPRKTKAAKRAEGEDVSTAAAETASTSKVASGSSSAAPHHHHRDGLTDKEEAEALSLATHHPGHQLRDGKTVQPSDIEGHVLRDGSIASAPPASSAALEPKQPAKRATRSNAKKTAVGSKRKADEISGGAEEESQEEEQESAAAGLSYSASGSSSSSLVKSFGQPGISQGIQPGGGVDSLLKGVGHGLIKQVLYTIPHPPSAEVKTVDQLKMEVSEAVVVVAVERILLRLKNGGLYRLPRFLPCLLFRSQCVTTALSTT
jgi:hypothetical protein